MKGDFTRFTFRPEKRYTSVLMQQGRMQLDADWNEQMSILGYLGQAQANDMIGGSGTSRSVGGFQIAATPDGQDLIISAGNYYVKGLLCELAPGSLVVARYDHTPTATLTTAQFRVRVPVFTVDGRPFAPGQWVEIASFADLPNPSDRQFRIADVNISDQTLDLFNPTLSPTDLKNQLDELAQGQARAVSIQLRRLLTYHTQPDFPEALITDLPAGADVPAGLVANAHYLVYLDAWQRHMTVLEDPDLREAALGSVDTTTRLKTVAQVRLLPIPPESSAMANLSPEQAQLALDRRVDVAFDALTLERLVYLNVRLRSQPNGNTPNQLLENHLYRVEIHQGGSLEDARFKWSRDNGTIVSAIARLSLQDNTLEVQNPEGDAARSFVPGQWVELINEPRELRNQPGILLRLKDVRFGGKLTFEPVNETINPDEFAPHHNPRLRGWDWTQSTAGLPLKSADPEGWIELERGIQVRFETELAATYQTGDYWLIPSRANGTIQWSRDQAGTFLRQPPLGIRHDYAQLALVKTADPEEEAAAITFEALDDQSDRRQTFPSLMSCIDNDRITFSSSIGIGVKQPEAQLHVRGSDLRDGKGRISADLNSTDVFGSGTAFIQELNPGMAIAVVDVAGTEITLRISEIQSDTRLTVTEPLTTRLVNARFTYQSPQTRPIIRFDTRDAQPQVVLTSDGDLGLNTATPKAKLDVKGTFRLGTDTESLQVAIDAAQVKFTTTATKGHSFNQSLTVAQGLTVEQSGGVTVNEGGVTIHKGGLTVNQGGVTLEAGDLRLTQASNLTLAQGSLTLGQGGLTVTAGNLSLGQGNLTLSQGNLTVATGTITVGGGLTVAGTATQSALTHGLATLSFASASGELQLNNTVHLANKAVTASNTSGDPIKLRVAGALRLGTDAANLAIAYTNKIANFTLSEADGRYQFDKFVVINGGLQVTGNLTLPSGNLTVSSGALTLGTVALSSETVDGELAVSIKNDVLRLGNNRNLLQIDPNAANNLVQLTTDQANGFSFNKTVRVSSGVVMMGNGRVGIGVNQAMARLHVKGMVQTASETPRDAIARFEGDSANDPQFFITIENDGQNKKRIVLGTVGGRLQLGTEEASNDENNVSVRGVLRVERFMTTGSSRALKENIADLSTPEVNQILAQLNPVKFNYKDDQTPHLGFIAEDVPDILATPDHKAINPVDIIAALTKIVKEHQNTMSVLGRLVRDQHKAIAQLEDKIAQLESPSPNSPERP